MSQTEAPSAGASGRAGATRLFASVLAPLSFLLLLGLVLARLSPHFLEQKNLIEIAIQAAVVAILACGQTTVIISGNIDLSVGATMALSGVIAALSMRDHHASVLAGVLISLGTGLAAGLISGAITAIGKIPSFIVTLGMMGIVYGAAGIFSGSQNIGSLPPSFSAFGSAELFGSDSRQGIPYAVVIMVAVAVLVHLLLSRTRWGRSIYALGGNREAARLSGISVPRATISVFALSGLLAGVAAVVNVARTSVASPGAGASYELYAVAATVIGGTSLFGGQGGILGTLIGALLMFEIRNGCALVGSSPEYERVAVGVVVIIAVLYDRFGPGRRTARSA